jgi:hypothetical protein
LISLTLFTTHTHIHTRSHIYIPSHIHTLTHTHILTHPLTHTHFRSLTHSHTYAPTHTHTHSHTLAPSWSHKSQTVNNGGKNPVFNETFAFEVDTMNAEQAILEIKVSM